MHHRHAHPAKEKVDHLSIKLLVIALLAIALAPSCTRQTGEAPGGMVTVEQALKAFDQGSLSLEDITAARGQTWQTQMCSYYLLHSNHVTAKMRLPLSHSCFRVGRYADAANLAAQYVEVYSNDWQGWAILGAANLVQKRCGAAVDAYTHAVELGDEGDRPRLAFAALAVGRTNLVSKMVPSLLALKRDCAAYDEVNRLEVVMVLTAYADMANDEDTFVKALDGISSEEISSREDLTKLVTAGCKGFKSEAVRKVAERMEPVVGKGD